MSTLTGTKILIVDDSKSVRMALSDACSLVGAKSHAVEDAYQALDYLEAHEVDVVITDVEMPGMNGFELCRRLKKAEKTRSLPVLILSSLDSDEDIETGFKVGAAAYVTKGNVVSALSERVFEVISRASLTTEHHVLVVDDTKSIQSFLTTGLAEEGYRATSAGNGLEALEMLKTTKPDIVLTDLYMPDMNGLELCRELNRNPEYSSIPVVVMSGQSDRETMHKAIRFGAATFVTKPFRIDQVAITLDQVLSNSFTMMLAEKRHLENEHDLIVSAITSLINALEKRDAYTRGHSEQVAKVAVSIAETMGGFSDQELERLQLIGRMHDIGKIGVPDKVLLKEGPLSDEEFEVIKLHTISVHDILSPIDSLRDVLEGATTHHERWDGNGYPRGLSGEDIPLCGRVIAVADVWDALTSDRPYRKAMKREKALSIMAEGRGEHFCPTCLDAFMSIMGN